MKKRKYDTAVAMLYVMGKEHLLPRDFRKSIPHSTISSWRKMDYTTYAGYQYRFLFEDHWDVIALKAKLVEQKKQLISIGKAWYLFGKEMERIVDGAKKDRAVQESLIKATDLLSESFSSRFALRKLALKPAQYREWKLISQAKCMPSVTSLCLRRYPNQISKKEIAKIKYYLSSPRFQHWPIASIAAYLFRNGKVTVSLYTWYKYARLFQLQHVPTRNHKKRKGLIAAAPNEYWHADTTYYFIAPTKKVCITIVMDNYSKMILGFAVAEKLGFDVIKDAISAALGCLNGVCAGESHLVMDGGWENQNTYIQKFLYSLSSYKLTQITALKDIVFSNSPVEAIHKILKGRYLQNRRFDGVNELAKFLRAAIHDYNTKRPHCKHGLRTPHEVYYHIPLTFEPKDNLMSAVRRRIENNKQTACSTCVANLAPYK